MKKIIIPFMGLVLLAAGFLFGRVTALAPQAIPTANPADISTPIITEPEPEISTETEPSTDEEQPEPEIKYVYVTSFYATVLQTEGGFLVQGNKSNSLYFREDYQFRLGCSDETKITVDGKPATIDDIVVGDLIGVSFYGDILESEPVQLNGIISINVYRQ